MTRPRKPAEQTTSALYRGADGHWHVRVTMGRRPDGGTERKHVQRGTKAELRDAVRDLERRRDAGTCVWTQDDVALGQWLEHWLEFVLPMTARWKTISTYRSQMHVHVIAALGEWRLSELRPEHLEEALSTDADQGPLDTRGPRRPPRPPLLAQRGCLTTTARHQPRA
jgi:integrase